MDPGVSTRLSKAAWAAHTRVISGRCRPHSRHQQLPLGAELGVPALRPCSRRTSLRPPLPGGTSLGVRPPKRRKPLEMSRTPSFGEKPIPPLPPPKKPKQVILSEMFYKVLVNTISDDLQEIKDGKGAAAGTGPRGAVGSLRIHHSRLGTERPNDRTVTSGGPDSGTTSSHRAPQRAARGRVADTPRGRVRPVSPRPVCRLLPRRHRPAWINGARRLFSRGSILPECTDPAGGGWRDFGATEPGVPAPSPARPPVRSRLLRPQPFWSECRQRASADAGLGRPRPRSSTMPHPDPAGGPHPYTA